MIKNYFLKDYVKAYKLWGFSGTFKHLYMFRRLKFGDHIGTDEHGNKYYENLSLPYGQHRWVEHKEWETGQLIETTKVPAEWFIWLHSMTDEVPLPDEQKEPKTGREVTKFSNVPYEHHRNEKFKANWPIIGAHQTGNRERGAGFWSYGYDKVEGNTFYAQPGSMSHPERKAQLPDVQEWTPSGSSGAKVEAKEEKWVTFFKQRQEMNRKNAEKATASS
eukprot:augustus_masked-scaffold_50-processed-gene-0.50-mRNA-1 protein AED:0.31 eAED:0.34 QI:0/-1/0/1/-1/1/1/0/218